jgi:alpha,alpha-trehalase
VTTECDSGQQWDAPNGWAPLQWIAFVGLKNYGFDELAERAARAWLSVNDRIFSSYGKMIEKYDVETPGKLAGGGEYTVQDGFGWSNGVYQALRQQLAKKPSE